MVYCDDRLRLMPDHCCLDGSRGLIDAEGALSSRATPPYEYTTWQADSYETARTASDTVAPFRAGAACSTDGRLASRMIAPAAIAEMPIETNIGTGLW